MINLDQLWGNAKQAAETGMNDLLHVGATAGLGWLEQQAIEVLQGDKAKREAAFQQTAAQTLAAPNTPGSLGSYMSNLIQQPVIKQYGPYVVIGLGAFAVAVLVVGGGKK